MRKADRNGFSLLEVLIFSAIFGIVVTAIYMMYSTSHTTFTRGQNRIEAQQNGRVAMERMAREIRTGGYDPSDVMNAGAPAPSTAIRFANANDITFIADVDGDNTTDQVKYSVNGNAQLVREVASWGGGPDFPAFVADVLADGVNSLDFTYCDGNDVCSPTPALGDIRRIMIQLTTQESDGLRTESFPLSMDVRLRNLQ